MKVRNFRAADDQWARFQRCAEASGLAVGTWCRRACDEAAELELLEIKRVEDLLAERERLQQGLTG